MNVAGSKECPEVALRDTAGEEPNAVCMWSNDEVEYIAPQFALELEGTAKTDGKWQGVPRP